ncbi:dihydrodipicolinate synthetase family protein [Hesseltinella vesiculosa]|uniref:Dihydrodipicolinate synthetase family protein n=1 Tax=Hesseltinella vesiculosa TaxID=101127 RepID=A0A1X2GQG1_9FUNG|nr:dihydrodipicolinate synthetase family protein [Hesseltinella vesiculosa]
MSASDLRIKPGVYVPIPIFFHDNEDLDFAALENHIAYLANTGLAGIVVQGSTGEAVHLTDEERIQVVRQAKAYIAKHDPSLTLIAGTGAGSVRNTLQLTKEAAAAGAEYAMILPPCYYRGSMDDEAMLSFFLGVADESPIPIIIYNYPGVTQGIDISPAVIGELAKHKNIAGIKGTDGNIGKVADLAVKTKGTGFTLLAGSTDFTLAAMTVGARGCIVGLGNALPRACVKLHNLFEQGNVQEAVKLQHQLVEPDNALCRWFGLPGVKAGLDHITQNGGPLRRPLRPLNADQRVKIAQAFADGLAIEKSLQISENK